MAVRTPARYQVPGSEELQGNLPRTRAHAALAPEKGRSAFDAMLAAFQGIEFLREHVPDDVRMHYCMTELPGPANVVPATAKG